MHIMLIGVPLSKIDQKTIENRSEIDPQKLMVFEYFLPSGESKIDQKSIKIASQSGLKLRG